MDVGRKGKCDDVCFGERYSATRSEFGVVMTVRRGAFLQN